MVLIKHSAFPPNAGLADLSGVSKIFYHLRQRFYPVEFADLCTLIDDIVLRDHVVLVGKTETTPKHYMAAIQPLIDEGVFRILAEPFRPARTETSSAAMRAAAQAAGRDMLTAASVEDADLEVTRLLGAEAKFGRPATVLLRNLHNFGVNRRPKFEHGIIDLVHRNRRLADDARALHIEIQRNGVPARGFVKLDVPPLALTVLKNSASFEQVIERLLDMRDTASELRHDTSVLFERLSNPATTLDRQAELTRKWEKKWRKSWDDAVADRMFICNTSTAMLSKGFELVKSLGDIRSWPDAVLKGIAVVGDVREATSIDALRSVHTPVRNYLLTSRGQMRAVVSRVFEKDPAVVDALMARLAAPNSLWRKAFRIERP